MLPIARCSIHYSEPMSIPATIRRRFHPLWRIRCTLWLFEIFHSLEFPLWVRCRSLGMKMRMMWFRDMNWLFKPAPKESEFNELMERQAGCHVL